MRQRRVLLIDDDPDVSMAVRAVLADEGYAVSLLADLSLATIRAAVDSLEPDCVLLDGERTSGFGRSWTAAARIHERERPIPVVMFTVDPIATAEARQGVSNRSRRAAFAAVLSKPFELDALLAVVAAACGTLPDAFRR